MIFVIGEILFDIFPEYERLGGAPFNFAYHLKHFGFPVRFVSRVGSDKYGRKILDRIEAAGFDPNDIQQDDAHPTGTVQVQLDNQGVPSFDIIPGVAYDYIKFKPEAHTDHLRNADIIYFGTLVQRSHQGFKQIQRFLHHKRPSTKSFYDINLRPKCYSDEVIVASLKNTDILKLNTDELQKCKHVTGIDQNDDSFIRTMMDQYSLNIIALTKGEDGSELHTSTASHGAAPTTVVSVVDTVGAGDAYAAMLAAGILKQWSPQKTLAMAAQFAAQICAMAGAIPESAEFYEPIRPQMRNGE